MDDQTTKAAFFKRWRGRMQEASWAAQFLHLDCDQRRDFRAVLQDPSYAAPEGCPSECRARWLVALNSLDAIEAAEALDRAEIDPQRATIAMKKALAVIDRMRHS